MNALVVGAGAMGQWVGEILQSLEQQPAVSFVDTETATAKEAAASIGGDAVTAEPTDSFDIVAVAVPIPVVGDAIRQYGHLATDGILDVSGVMGEPVAEMERVAPDCERASYHPLFAPENEPGNIPVVSENEGAVIAALNDALTARNNHVFETTADQHDSAMETVQARTHAAVLAFALASEEVSPVFHTPISSELSRLAKQVTSGESRVYADIQETFDGATDVAAAAEQIAQADREAFQELYEELSGTATEPAER